MRREREFILRIRLLGDGPEEAALYRAEGGVEHHQVATEVFSPFDGALDVHRWLWRNMRLDIRAHPML